MQRRLQKHSQTTQHQGLPGMQPKLSSCILLTHIPHKVLPWTKHLPQKQGNYSSIVVWTSSGFSKLLPAVWNKTYLPTLGLTYICHTISFIYSESIGNANTIHFPLSILNINLQVRSRYKGRGTAAKLRWKWELVQSGTCNQEKASKYPLLLTFTFPWKCKMLL